VIALVIGVPMAWLLARSSFPGQRLLRALVTLPLVLPPVVGGSRCCWHSAARAFSGRT
jgi:molybdate transport system permease protein